MTPTPEMLAMAERIADEQVFMRSLSHWGIAYKAALTAIMETSEKAAQAAENLNFFIEVSELLGMTKQEMSERTCHAVAATIRNGEHLR